MHRVSSGLPFECNFFELMPWPTVCDRVIWPSSGIALMTELTLGTCDIANRCFWVFSVPFWKPFCIGSISCFWSSRSEMKILKLNYKSNFEVCFVGKNLIACDIPICSVFRAEAANGRKKDPNMQQFNTIPDSTNNVWRQPNSLMKNATSGANTNVPKPEPATAIPMAMDRFFSKCVDTLTMAWKRWRKLNWWKKQF